MRFGVSRSLFGRAVDVSDFSILPVLGEFDVRTLPKLLLALPARKRNDPPKYQSLPQSNGDTAMSLDPPRDLQHPTVDML
jgi:hypothetical protein